MINCTQLKFIYYQEFESQHGLCQSFKSCLSLKRFKCFSSDEEEWEGRPSTPVYTSKLNLYKIGIT